MQITDMLTQYNRNLANGIEPQSGTQGIKQVVSSLQQMAVGNVFEGSINHMENGVVTIGLSDGKTVQARLDGNVSVNVGESMFFQVKSNSGEQIAIRPFSDGIASNPTLLKALDAANLQVNARMLTMVNTMMEQSMSIDKQSLMQMARLVMGNSDMNVSDIVQMTKLGIPVTEEMAAQFENYKSDQYAVLDQLETVMKELPAKLTNGSISREQLIDLNKQIADIFIGNFKEDNLNQGQPEIGAFAKTMPDSMNSEPLQAKIENGILQTKDGSVLLQADVNQQSGPDQMMVEKVPVEKTVSESATAKAVLSEIVPEETKAVVIEENGRGQQMKSPIQQIALSDTTLQQVFGNKSIQQFANQLQSIPEFRNHPLLFTEGALNTNVTTKELLQAIRDVLADTNENNKAELSEFLTSKNYRILLRSVMEDDWLLKPQDLQTENKVKELYGRLNTQMEQIENTLKSFGQNSTQFSDTAAGIRSNIQFMNYINQTYAYVQIPLKLSGQNVHSDLYVYTDRRREKADKDEFSAFLHLDMEHLGATDVSIKMRQKKVTTNFYLSDDVSYNLIMEHMDLLEERLEKKGYSMTIQVTNQDEKVNFVEELLKADQSSAGGMVHRYSFDMRA